MLPVSIQLTLSLLLGCALLVAVATLAWGLRAGRHRAECDAQRMFEQLDLVRAEMMLLSDRIDGLETRAPKMQERPAPPEVRAPVVPNSSAPRGYEVAARLARGGATCEELISSCGLSRHEAELLIRLHKAEAARAKNPAGAAPLKVGETPRARLSAVG